MKPYLSLGCFAAVLILGAASFKRTSPTVVFKTEYLKKAPKQLASNTTLDYTLDASTVHISTAPNNSPYSPTDFSAMTLPLVAEGYAQNKSLVSDPTTIHAGAAGYTDVFFGGDAPSSPDSHGASTTTLFTTQDFTLDNFPISLETNIYSSGSSLLYNEFYFWIGRADPVHYNQATTWFPDTDSQAGFLLGGYPNRLLFSDRGTHLTTNNFIRDITHTLATYGQWFNYKLTLDVVNGQLIVKGTMINGMPAFTENVVLTDVANINWENNFKVGLCVDDLASGFKITYKDAATTNVEEIATKNKTDKLKMKAFPIPARHQLSVSSSDDHLKINKILVMDASGKQFNLPYQISGSGLLLELNDLPAGTYYLNLDYNDGEQQTLPFVKTN